MSPREVGDCSFWQFVAAVEGWKAANTVDPDGGGAPTPPTPEEHDALVARFG